MAKAHGAEGPFLFLHLAYLASAWQCRLYFWRA